MGKIRYFKCIVCKIEVKHTEFFGGMCRECKADENQRKRESKKELCYKFKKPDTKLECLYRYKGDECRRCGFKASRECLVFCCKTSYKTLGLKDKLNRTMKSLFELIENYNLYCRNCQAILSNSIKCDIKEKIEDKYDRCKYCDDILNLEEKKYKSCIGCFAAEKSERLHYELIWGFGKNCKGKKCKAGQYTRELLIYNKDTKSIYDVLSVDSFNLAKITRELQIQGYDTYCHGCTYKHMYDDGSEPIEDMI